jgi:hypothetical protein
MVARLVCIVLLLSGLGAAAEPDPQLVRDSYEEGDNIYKPRPYKRSAVATVVITENATLSVAGQGAADDCSGFLVTPRLIKQYFGRAKTVGSRDYSHTLDWSPCVANGSLVLADGRRANWGVQQLGLGWLHINHRLHYFHCEKRCGVYLLGVDLDPKLPPK